MKIELKGRKAIVTGSTAGIGLAIAEGLARAGASVVVNGRTEGRVAAALQGLRALLPEADLTGIAADLATPKGSAALAAHAAVVEEARDALLPLPDGRERRLVEAMRYATLGGGKRLRGFLVMEVAGLFGVAVACAARAAASTPTVGRSSSTRARHAPQVRRWASKAARSSLSRAPRT